MPAGLTKRIYKKRYKAALTRIADRIPAAFVSKADRKRWISEVTNLRMQGMAEGRDQKHDDQTGSGEFSGKEAV